MRNEEEWINTCPIALLYSANHSLTHFGGGMEEASPSGVLGPVLLIIETSPTLVPTTTGSSDNGNTRYFENCEPFGAFWLADSSPTLCSRFTRGCPVNGSKTEVSK